MPPVSVDVSGFSSADHSASGSGTIVGPSGDGTEVSGVSSASGEGGSTSGFQVTFSGRGDFPSGEGSGSAGPQEAGEGSTVTYTSGVGSGVSTSGSGVGVDEPHPGFSGFPSGFGPHSGSGSGDLSGSGWDIVMVDREMVDLSKTHQGPTEQEFGRGVVDVSGSGSTSGAGTSGFFSGDVSGITSGSAFPDGVSFIDQGLVDLTDKHSGEQEVSGYRPSGSGFPHSGFPSGFPSSGFASGAPSEDVSQPRGDVIYLTDDDMMEVTVRPSVHRPEQGRGLVEVSGQGSGSGIYGETTSTWDSHHHHHISAGGEPTAEGLSIALPPGSTVTYPEYIANLGQSGVEQEAEQEQEQEGRAGSTEEIYVTTPSSAYTSPTTAPSISLVTPAVVEQPAVVDGMWL